MNEQRVTLTHSSHTTDASMQKSSLCRQEPFIHPLKKPYLNKRKSHLAHKNMYGQSMISNKHDMYMALLKCFGVWMQPTCNTKFLYIFWYTNNKCMRIKHF